MMSARRERATASRDCLKKESYEAPLYSLTSSPRRTGELVRELVRELAVRSVSEFALDGIPLVRCIGSVVRPWVPEPSN